MPTTVEAVETYLETDLALNEALARGFLNVRKTARWLIEDQDWETTEEAVVSALRRYDPPREVNVEDALHLLASTQITFDTGLALLTLPRTAQALDVLSKLTKRLGPEDDFAVLPARKQVRLLLAESATHEAMALAGCVDGAEIVPDLGEIQIEFPEEQELTSTSVAVAINVLGHEGISVRSVFSHLSSCSVIVPERQTPRAFELLEALGDRV